MDNLNTKLTEPTSKRIHSVAFVFTARSCSSMVTKVLSQNTSLKDYNIADNEKR